MPPTVKLPTLITMPGSRLLRKRPDDKASLARACRAHKAVRAAAAAFGESLNASRTGSASVDYRREAIESRRGGAAIALHDFARRESHLHATGGILEQLSPGGGKVGGRIHLNRGARCEQGSGNIAKIVHRGAEDRRLGEAAGSSGLCPPEPGLSEPPTNTASARLYTAASSPIVSSTRTLPAGPVDPADPAALANDPAEMLLSERSLRRIARQPDCVTRSHAAANRSGFRGARISNACGHFWRTAAKASRTGGSSPAITLPATITGPRCDRFSSSWSQVTNALDAGAAISYFIFPDTRTRSVAAPSAIKRDASWWDWTMYRVASFNMRRRKLPRSPPLAFTARENPRKDLSERRPFTKTTGTPVFRAWRSRFGQISVSSTTMTPGRTA